MQLNIIHQQWPTNLDHWAAIGVIDIEEALRWVQAIQILEDLEVLSARSAHLTLQASRYLLPDTDDMTELTFDDKESVETWSYCFMGTPEELERLVDKISVVQARRDLALSD